MALAIRTVDERSVHLTRDERDTIRLALAIAAHDNGFSAAAATAGDVGLLLDKLAEPYIPGVG